MKSAPLLFIISISLFSCLGEIDEPKNRTADNSIAETVDSTQIRVLHTEFEKLHGMASQFQSKGKIREAIVADSLALILAEKVEPYSKCIEIVKSLESKYNTENNKVLAIQMCYKGISIAEKNKDTISMADLYSSIGLSYFYVNDFEKALPIHLKSLELSKSASYSFGIASALVDVGSDYVAMSQFEKAIPYYLECKKYADTLKGTIYEPHIYNSVAAAWTFSKQYDSAYIYCELACRLAEKLQHKRTMASTTVGMAKLKYFQGYTREANELAKKAFQLCSETKFTAQLPDLYIVSRDIHKADGNYKKALDAHEKYVSIHDSITDENTGRIIQYNEYALTLEKKNAENRLLIQGNVLRDVKINRNLYLSVVLTVILLLTITIGILLFRQSRTKAMHKYMIAEQKILRAQMNPHFIFNALNSIQNFIMRSQNLEAETYLAKFSRLLRNILETGTEDRLRLSQEIEILKGYLEIEALRFGGAFNYTIRIEDELKKMNPYIPILMVQPFIENAIWHGLLPKDDYKNVDIDFIYSDNHKCTCIIDDNGIGRNESLKRRRDGVKKQQALDFTAHRLSLMNTVYTTNCKMVILDKYDNTGHSCGTTIKIDLPFIHK